MAASTVYSIFILLLFTSVKISALSEPSGRLKLYAVFVNDLFDDSIGTKERITVYLKCSTQSGVGKAAFDMYGRPGSKSIIFPKDYDMKVTLLSHESVECELMEKEDGENEKSLGLCEYTFARFLAPRDNVVTCNLSDGSSFVLGLVCPHSCPLPVATPTVPYCKLSKKLQAVRLGKSHSFSDGSPGFALYAPNSECMWMIPRAMNGTTNFLFSRMDLGTGDVVEAYSSPDGVKKKFIKRYTSNSVPESVSTSEKFLILKFTSDSVDEGLGFAGFYYYTSEVPSTPVAISEAKKQKNTSDTEENKGETKENTAGFRKGL